MQIHDLALQRNKYKHLSDEEWRWLLQQEEGRSRTADKLPTFVARDDWWFPVRLSCEQCSSEHTARYKVEVIEKQKPQAERRRLVDLTGGYGIDCFFLSGLFAHTDYVERDEELCRIAKHNFEKGIAIHNCSAEAFLQTADRYDLIYIDPARRDGHGSKVFRLVDCTPNVVELLPTLQSHLAPNGVIMLKLSPMLDLSQAIAELSIPGNWDVHIVAVKNEVKEVLLVSTQGEGHICATDLSVPGKAFVFTRASEQVAHSTPVQSGLTSGRYLYEPNAAILKAGAYKLIGERFGLEKLDVNTHLYTSEQKAADFPGRIWQITSLFPLSDEEKMSQANIVTRNYPMSPEQIKKKLKLRDGGDNYIIGCRVNGKPVLIKAQRIQ